MVVKGIVKGDTINFFFTLNEDITDWKIRAEIYDRCHESIKLATENSGGSSGDITISDAINGEFEIVVAKNLTTNFNDKSYIEIEVEKSSGEIYTVLQSTILLDSEQIKWTDPS